MWPNYAFIDAARRLAKQAERVNRTGLNMAAEFWDMQAGFWQHMPLSQVFAAASANTAQQLRSLASIGQSAYADHTRRPDFNLTETRIDAKDVKVERENLRQSPFYTLSRFRRDTTRHDPKLLIVAPMSGHYASLLRSTVAALLPDHDVHIIDWENIRDVSASAGKFDFERYMDCVIECLETMGSDTHVMGISQSTVPLLAATAVLAGQNSPHQPRSMTLIGGPIDTRKTQTKLHDFVRKTPLSWFKKKVIDTVPSRYKGAGRKVYPGHIQLASMLHGGQDQHRDNMEVLLNGKLDQCCDKAELDEFYKDYFAMTDLEAGFFLDTLRHVYQDHSLASGTMTYRGQKVDLSKITKTGLLTVEGDADEICPPDETTAAHDLCQNIPARKRKQLLMAGYGHYAIAMGSKFQKNIAPQLSSFIRKIGSLNKKPYSPANQAPPLPHHPNCPSAPKAR